MATVLDICHIGIPLQITLETLVIKTQIVQKAKKNRMIASRAGGKGSEFCSTMSTQNTG